MAAVSEIGQDDIITKTTTKFERQIPRPLTYGVIPNFCGLYFLDAPGGIGKTFVISLILATIRLEQKISLALASSGIAATLLGGRTAHSCHFAIECTMIETPICNISRNSTMAKVLRLTELSGDFRQTLPIIPRSTPADEINACLMSSVLWRYVQKFTLNINMLINLQNDPAAHEFSKQLLEIGDGKIQIDRTKGLIAIPNNFCTIVQ
nr:uncharacterized protein LOC113392846 [Vanessa tameamea]